MSVQKGASVWYGPEVLDREEEWLFTFSNFELEELKVAADLLVESSPDEGYLSMGLLSDVNNFQLSKIMPRIKDFVERLHNGLGFVVWRGIPIQSWSHKHISAAFLIIGKYMGSLRIQNAKGHVLGLETPERFVIGNYGHVKDLGLTSSDPNVRVYQTKERQTFHTDSCDVVGLLCCKMAKSGGLSLLVSSGTIYNEMLKRNPDLAHELLQPLPTDKRGEVSEGSLPYFNIPVYNEFKGYLSAIYQRQYINSSQRFPNAPRLTERQISALDLFDSLADDPKLNFTMQLQPGDIQFVHNHSLLHDRSAFEDWVDPDQKRHLLRIWIATPNARPLPPVFSERFGSVTVGDRGGLDIPGVVPVAPLCI